MILQDDSSQENDQIRSGSKNNSSLSEKVQWLLDLTHQHLPLLEKHYDNPIKLAEFQANEQKAATALLKDPLLRNANEQTFLWLFEHIQSDACKWYVSFRVQYPNVPVQLKHLLMKNFLKERLDIMAVEQKGQEAACDTRNLQENAERSIEAWEERKQHRPNTPKTEGEAPQEGQQSQTTVIDTPVQVDTHVTDSEPVSDVTDQEGKENPYRDIVGMRPRMAVHILQIVRRETPDLQPVLYRAMDGTQVIEVIMDNQAYYLVTWEHYQEVRQMLDLSLLPLPTSLQTGFERQPERVRKRDVRVSHNQVYLAKCRELKKQREEGITV
jgi:hypothetical protein